jgi:hypothetical protein
LSLFLSGWKGVCLMNRAILILFIALVLAGCKSQTPSVDPFFGRTTVPPPPTGSVSGQAADPYYQSAQPVQPGSLQANAPYNQGRISTSPTNAPLYSGSNWTNSSNPANSASGPNWTNQINTPRYSSPASSALTGPSAAGAAGTAGTSTYPMQPVSQTNPTSGTPTGGYSPQTTPAQPASMPSTLPGTTWPGTNQYTPPSGSLNNNYPRGAGVPNSQTSTPSPNRVATPFFAGGVPNRTTIPVTDGGTGALNNTAGTANVNNPPNYNPTINSYQNGSNPQGNNFLPASRQSTVPVQTQPQNKSTQPAWRESTSSDARVIDDNVEPVSNTEAKESQ